MRRRRASRSRCCEVDWCRAVGEAARSGLRQHARATGRSRRPAGPTPTTAGEVPAGAARRIEDESAGRTGLEQARHEAGVARRRVVVGGVTCPPRRRMSRRRRPCVPPATSLDPSLLLRSRCCRHLYSVHHAPHPPVTPASRSPSDDPMTRRSWCCPTGRCRRSRLTIGGPVAGRRARERRHAIARAVGDDASRRLGQRGPGRPALRGRPDRRPADGRPLDGAIEPGEPPWTRRRPARTLLAAIEAGAL